MNLSNTKKLNVGQSYYVKILAFASNNQMKSLYLNVLQKIGGKSME